MNLLPCFTKMAAPPRHHILKITLASLAVATSLLCILETLSWGSSNLGHADQFIGQTYPSKVALVKRGIWSNLLKKGQPRKNKATKPIPDCVGGQCAFLPRAKQVPVGAVRKVGDTSAAGTVRPREGHNASPKHASAQMQSEVRTPLPVKRPKKPSGRRRTTLQDLFYRSPPHGVAAHRPGKEIQHSSSSSSAGEGSSSDVSYYSARSRLSATPDISSISSFSSSSSSLYPESHSSREIVEAPSSHSSSNNASPSRWLHDPVEREKVVANAGRATRMSRPNGTMAKALKEQDKPAAEKQNRNVVTTSEKSQWPDHGDRILNRNYVPTPDSVWDPHHEADFYGKGLDFGIKVLETWNADRELRKPTTVRELKNDNTVQALKKKNRFRWLKNVNPVQWLKNKHAVRELKRENAAWESENAAYDSYRQDIRKGANEYERYFRAGHNSLHPGERK